MTRRHSHNDAFIVWLGKNRRRFPTPIVLRRKRADGVRQYRFPAAPALRVDVFEGEVRVAAVHKRQFVDFLIDLDIEVKRGADKMYFCQWCEDNGHTERYPDRTALLEAHTFEPFLAWCFENLREDKLLVLEFTSECWSNASIRDTNAVERCPPPYETCILRKVLERKWPAPSYS